MLLCLRRTPSQPQTTSRKHLKEAPRHSTVRVRQNSVPVSRQKASVCLRRPLFKSCWPRWKPLERRMPHSRFKRLHKTWQNWQNIKQSPCLRAQTLSIHLLAVPGPNWDKMIMTPLAAIQLPHCSIMSENEIDLKILLWLGLDQKGLLCWLY